MSEIKYYNYIVTLDLTHESFANHPLIHLYSGFSMYIDSIGFNLYQDALASLNKVCAEYSAVLNDISPDRKTHSIAWEMNPLMKLADSKFITPEEQWTANELLRAYIVVNQEDVKLITLENLHPAVSVILYHGKRNTEIDH